MHLFKCIIRRSILTDELNARYIDSLTVWYTWYKYETYNDWGFKQTDWQTYNSSVAFVNGRTLIKNFLGKFFLDSSKYTCKKTFFSILSFLENDVSFTKIKLFFAYTLDIHMQLHLSIMLITWFKYCSASPYHSYLLYRYYYFVTL